jgi:hypothetical protein
VRPARFHRAPIDYEPATIPVRLVLAGSVP